MTRNGCHGIKRLQCVVCSGYFEKTVGVFGRNSKHCPQCRPKAKSNNDTNSLEVMRNSEVLSRPW